MIQVKLWSLPENKHIELKNKFKKISPVRALTVDF